MAAPAADACAAGPDLPYHLLARRGRTQWWRPLAELGIFLGLLAVLALLVLVVGVVQALLGGAEEVSFGSPLLGVVIVFGSLALLLPLIALAVRWGGRRPFGTVSSVVGRLRWRWMLSCVPAAVVVVGAQLAVVAVFGAVHGEPVSLDAPGWPGWGTYLALAAVVVAVIPFQAAAEE
ncbi:hypothetical protein [Kineococcus xinjiangensis]|uniref:hypothetical protein n=1 Tax=Kineococcus xinjiangensis TaxID=512762 RepID=UPI000CEC5769|nr:hypothetical protein [Kineococcus xinjiangensis]